MIRTLAVFTLLVVFAGLLTACSRRQQDWEAARAANTAESYESFVAKYPQGEFTAQAKARADELREAADWQEALAANTLPAFQAFVRKHPDGRMSDEARIRIEGFALGGVAPDAGASASAISPSSAPTSSSATSTARAPSPQLATVSPPAASGPGSGYRIQLGAFAGGDKQAMGEWRRLAAQYPDLLGGLSPSVKLATTDTGHLYRLQAGMADETHARAICESLKSKGHACVVVPP
jgi:cell division septation protein DedD